MNIPSICIAEQSEKCGNAVLLTRFERLPGSTGTGPLHGPAGAEPRARRTFLALYADAIGRHRFTADFGTNGGAELTRPETPPAPSDTVLVSQTRYAADGRPGCEIAPDGRVTESTRDRFGQVLRTVEALGTPERRINRFRWRASGQMVNLIPDT